MAISEETLMKATYALTLLLVAGFFGCSPEEPKPMNPTDRFLLATEGARIYEESCIQCHLDGTDGPAAPALIGSPTLQNPTQLVLGTVRGREGRRMVNGVESLSIMPAFPDLTESELAAVLTYIQATFGEPDTAGISPEEVASILAENP